MRQATRSLRKYAINKQMRAIDRIPVYVKFDQTPGYEGRYLAYCPIPRNGGWGWYEGKLAPFLVHDGCLGLVNPNPLWHWL